MLTESSIEEMKISNITLSGLFVPLKITFLPHRAWAYYSESSVKLITFSIVGLVKLGRMIRRLSARALAFVLISCIIVQNSAYLTIIERGLRACRSSANSNEDDSRVRRWGWWPPVITQVCKVSSYTFLLPPSRLKCNEAHTLSTCELSSRGVSGISKIVIFWSLSLN